jgi:hypothetical protein
MANLKEIAKQILKRLDEQQARGRVVPFVQNPASGIKLHKPTAEATDSISEWKNPHPQGTSEAHQASLLLVMESVWLTAWEKHRKGYWTTPGILELEKAIGRIQQLVLGGMAPVDRFREVVQAWDELVSRQDNIKKEE